jgi:hypothetical protein
MQAVSGAETKRKVVEHSVLGANGRAPPAAELKKKGNSVDRVELIYDDHVIYLITTEGVQTFDARYDRDLPFDCQKAIAKALGYTPDVEKD